MPVAVGTNFGPYVIEAFIGRGGMGEVYRAREVALGRSVALKLLRPEATPNDRARFLREARAAAAVAHRSIVVIYAAGEIEGHAFLSMELLSGTTLRRILVRELSFDVRLGWVRNIAEALAAVHAAGHIHRDVKPENIFVVDGAVKLLDFGIAKRDPYLSPTEDISSPPSVATQDGIVIGTPRYMSPEQGRAQPVDARADQFAWGLVAYEILAGVHPSGRSPAFAFSFDWREAPRPLTQVAPEVPFGVASVVMQALAIDPNERFPSMNALLETLNESRTTGGTLGSHRSQPPYGPSATKAPARGGSSKLLFAVAMLGVLVVGLTALAVTLAFRSRQPAPAPAPAPIMVTPVSVASSVVVEPPSLVVEAGTTDKDDVVDASVGPKRAHVSKECSCLLPGPPNARGKNICVDQESICICNDDGSYSSPDFCLVPWVKSSRSNDCDDRRIKGKRTLDACVGYPFDTNVLTSGKLRCSACVNRDIYRGVRGAPCRGVDDDDGKTKMGTWWCAD